MKLAVTGSRTIKEFDFSDLFCKRTELFRTFLGRKRITRIICGGAKGIDSLAASAAEKLNIPVKIILPDYKIYKKGAPLMRNREIVDACDALLAVWNGRLDSHGTIYTIRYALIMGKKVFLITNLNGRIVTKIVNDELER